MILSIFAQKMVNSGHSVSSVQYVLVHGITKYQNMVENSRRPPTDPMYRPIHSPKEFNLFNRKLHKMLARSSWYTEEQVIKKSKWRHLIPESWSGSKPAQYCLPGMPYSTLMQVPSTRDSRLFKMLCKAEPRIAKLTGYEVKYTERSGKQLCKVLTMSPALSNARCSRNDCQVCLNTSANGPTMCNVKGVVYEAVCKQCDTEHRGGLIEKHRGRYVGQTSQTLYERSKKHIQGLRSHDMKGFAFKHWALVHSDSQAPPKLVFSVVKKHKDPLSRLVHEAVRIPTRASMNSKGERGGYRIARLMEDKTE